MNHLPADNLHEMSLLREQQTLKVLFVFMDRRIWSALLLQLGYYKHNVSTQTQEIINWIHDKVMCCRLYEAVKTVHLLMKDPDICDL